MYGVPRNIPDEVLWFGWNGKKLLVETCRRHGTSFFLSSAPVWSTDKPYARLTFQLSLLPIPDVEAIVATKILSPLFSALTITREWLRDPAASRTDKTPTELLEMG